MSKSIKSRVMFRIYLLVMVLLAATGFAMYYVFSKIVLQKALEDAGARIEKLTTSLEGTIDDVFRFTQYLSVSPEIRKFLAQESYRTPRERIHAIENVVVYLQNLIFLKEYIHSLALITNTGHVFWTVSPYDDYFAQLLERENLKNVTKFGVTGFSRVYSLPVKFNMTQQADIISYFSDIYEVRKKQAIGRMVLNLDLQILLKDAHAFEQGFDNLLILDESGVPLFSMKWLTEPLPRDPPSAQLTTTRTPGGYYFSKNVAATGWKIVGAIDGRKILFSMNYTVFAILALSLLFSYVLSGFLVLPILLTTMQQIVTLNNGMKAVAAGDFKTRINLAGTSELEEVADVFHRMTQDLERSMSEAVENLRAKQRISFELLLAEVNPHFIYNTLNSVVYLARKKKHREIISMMEAFISLLQDTIRLGDNMILVRVAQEVEVVKKYITIQEYRYSDRFTVSISADPQCSDVLIPKAILQPLVENAILHGICPKAGRGRIEILVGPAETGSISISVRDDGVGIDSETLARILSRGEPPRESGQSGLRPIGIANVIGKLDYVYKKDYRFGIESRSGCGTVVTIVVPVSPPRELSESGTAAGTRTR